MEPPKTAPDRYLDFLLDFELDCFGQRNRSHRQLYFRERMNLFPFSVIFETPAIFHWLAKLLILFSIRFYCIFVAISLLILSMNQSVRPIPSFLQYKILWE